jgi:hypothetical protein
MVTLKVEVTDRTVGEVSDEDFRLLQSLLEEEGPEDRDYWIDLPTIELVAERGGSEQLVNVLRNAVAGTPEGVEITFDR